MAIPANSSMLIPDYLNNFFCEDFFDKGYDFPLFVETIIQTSYTYTQII